MARNCAKVHLEGCNRQSAVSNEGVGLDRAIQSSQFPFRVNIRLRFKELSMSSKMVSVDTERDRGLLYRIDEYNGTHYVYNYGGFWVTKQGCIGETRSLGDALEIIKLHVKDKVQNIKISDW